MVLLLRVKKMLGTPWYVAFSFFEHTKSQPPGCRLIRYHIFRTWSFVFVQNMYLRPKHCFLTAWLCLQNRLDLRHYCKVCQPAVISIWHARNWNPQEDLLWVRAGRSFGRQTQATHSISSKRLKRTVVQMAKGLVCMSFTQRKDDLLPSWWWIIVLSI